VKAFKHLGNEVRTKDRSPVFYRRGVCALAALLAALCIMPAGCGDSDHGIGSERDASGVPGDTSDAGGSGGKNGKGGIGGNAGNGDEGGAVIGDSVDGGSDAGVAGGSSPVDCPDPGALLPEGACQNKIAGIHAFKIAADVVWTNSSAGTPGWFMTTYPGRGKLSYYMMVTIPEVCNDGTFKAEVRPCGVEIPPLLGALLEEAYDLRVPGESFDSNPEIPAQEVKGSTTGFTPGKKISIPPVTSLLGISLPSTDADWPTVDEVAGSTFTCLGGKSGSDCFPDIDHDGHPGLTAKFVNDGAMAADTGCGASGTGPCPRSAFPLSRDISALQSTGSRAAEAYLGFRVTASGSVAINDNCNDGKGEGAIKNFDLRSWSCWRTEPIHDMWETMPTTPKCDAVQALFMDWHLPEYQPLVKDEAPESGLGLSDDSPSQGALSSFVRLGGPDETFTCADVRAAQFPK
jgi:hypothetical protein